MGWGENNMVWVAFLGMPFWGCGIPLKPSFGGDFRAKNGVCHLAEFGTPNLPSQKHPPPLPANLPLEQDTPKTPGLEHPQRSSRGGPVTLIIRVPGTPKRGGGFDPQNGGKNSLWGHSGCAWGTPKREVFGVGGCFWGIFWGGVQKPPFFQVRDPQNAIFAPRKHFLVSTRPKR